MMKYRRNQKVFVAQGNRSLENKLGPNNVVFDIDVFGRVVNFDKDTVTLDVKGVPFYLRYSREKDLSQSPKKDSDSPNPDVIYL